jgi:Tetracyclin repressor-like, C-terminal domain
VRLHGFVSLEIGGNFASMGLDADALFRRVAR